jgi:DNA-binding protein YbaB
MSEIDAFAAGREGDLGRLLRELDAWNERLARTLGELGAERVDGTDANGVVRARVTGTGRLAGLHIDPRGLRGLDHAGLAAAVMEAVAAARAALGERLTELTGPPPDGDPGDPLAGHVERVIREG